VVRASRRARAPTDEGIRGARQGWARAVIPCEDGTGGPVIEGEFERLGEKAPRPDRDKDRDQI